MNLYLDDADRAFTNQLRSKDNCNWYIAKAVEKAVADGSFNEEFVKDFIELVDRMLKEECWAQAKDVILEFLPRIEKAFSDSDSTGKLVKMLALAQKQLEQMQQDTNLHLAESSKVRLAVELQRLASNPPKYKAVNYSEGGSAKGRPPELLRFVRGNARLGACR